MRRLVIAAVIALTPWLVNANDFFGEATPASVEIAQFDEAPTVIVTPIPTPAAVTELLTPMAAKAPTRPAKKLKVAKAQPRPTILLSRTERHQLALLAPKPKAGDPPLPKYVNDEDGESIYDSLPLHRSFNRPKVFKDPGEDDDEEAIGGISDTVKLRLFMARMKALEAHALASAADARNDADLPETVKLRLFLARMKAVEAHQKKFS